MLSNLHQFVSDCFGSFAGVMFLWTIQTFIVLGCTWIAVKIDPSRSAATRYRIWLIAILLCGVLVPLSLLFRSLPAPARSGVADPAPIEIPIALQTAAPRAAVRPVLISVIQFGVPALWLVGVGICLVQLGRSLSKLRRIQQAAKPVSSAELGCDEAWSFDPGATCPAIVLSESIQSPRVAGIFRPIIVMPADIASWTTPLERAAMLCHEAAHIERRDPVEGLLVSLVRGLLFFHPMVHFACNYINLEREVACDEKALAGTEPKLYAESILKAAERSLAPNALHHAAFFASKKTFQHRLEMIMNIDRSIPPQRQWRFLPVPIVVLGFVTWLLMPPGSGIRASASETVSSGAASTPAASSHSGPSTSGPAARPQGTVVSKEAIWVDTVKRGTLVIDVKGLGEFTSVSAGHWMARIVIPSAVAGSVAVDQQATVGLSIADPNAPGSNREAAFGGRVVKLTPRGEQQPIDADVLIDSKVIRFTGPGGQQTVETGGHLESKLPSQIGVGTRVDGIISVGQLDDVLYIGRTVRGASNATIQLFKLSPDGKSASRVQATLGQSSSSAVQVIDGLAEGDRVIISDMSAYEGVEKITIE